jgi:hypothetical protein
VLKRYEDVSFAKALGTVVTERAIDTLLVMLITGFTLIFQLKVFNIFFNKTGTNIGSILNTFSSTGYIVTGVCALAVIILLLWLLRRLSIYNKVKTTLKGMWQGRYFAEKRKECTSFYHIHGCHLGKLFRSLLSNVLLLRCYKPSWIGLCNGDIRRWKHCRYCAYT